MKKPLKLFITLFLMSSLFACTLPGKGSATGTPSDSVVTKVAATLTALAQSEQQTLTAQAPTATATVSMPTLTPSATSTLTPEVSPTPTNTPIPKPGTIAGGISGYPFGSVPRLAVVVYQQEAPYNYAYFITAPGATYFSIGGQYVIPGTWQVVAYDASGNSGGCTTMVTVKPGETVTCDITDWVSAYRLKPDGVPNP